MLTVGYIRFSFFGISDTFLSKGIRVDQDAYAEQLYNPERMEQRFHFFEKMCLPSIRDQTDQDFQIILLTSPTMPTEYLNRLQTLVEGIPQIRLHVSSSTAVLDALKPINSEIVSDNTENWITFRLDDDDAIAATTIENLKHLGRQAFVNQLITLSRGAQLLCYEGTPYLLRRFQPYHSVGWAKVQGPKDRRSPFMFAHYGAARRFPALIDPRPFSHVYCLHEAADTVGRKRRTIPREVSEYLKKPYTDENLQSLIEEVDEAFPSIGYAGFIDAISNQPMN